MIKGTDESKYDYGHDWTKYDWDFAFIKCSEGYVEDPQFRTHWKMAEGHTLRAPYHFFRPLVDPKTSAFYAFELMADVGFGELPMALDLEKTDGKSSVIDMALTWMSWYEYYSGHRPVVYSSPGFLSSVKAHLYPSLANYKLWLAQYYYDNYSIAERTEIISQVLTGAKFLLPPVTPLPFKRVLYHQWTSRGNPADVPGYNGPKLAVDFNFYLGTGVEFLSELIGSPPAPPIGDPMAGTVTLRSNVSNEYRSIRKPTNHPNVPHITGTKIDQMNAGTTRTTPSDQFYVYENDAYYNGTLQARKGDKWWHLLDSNGAVVGTIAEIHKGIRYLVAETNDNPPPDPDPIPAKTVRSVTIHDPTFVEIEYSDGTKQTL